MVSSNLPERFETFSVSPNVSIGNTHNLLARPSVNLGQHTGLTTGFAPLRCVSVFFQMAFSRKQQLRPLNRNEIWRWALMHPGCVALHKSAGNPDNIRFLPQPWEPRDRAVHKNHITEYYNSAAITTSSLVFPETTGRSARRSSFPFVWVPQGLFHTWVMTLMTSSRQQLVRLTQTTFRLNLRNWGCGQLQLFDLYPPSTLLNNSQ